MTAAITRPGHRLPASAVLGTDIATATTVDEALQMAGLDWGLQMHEAKALTVLTDTGVISTSIPGQKLLLRDDSFTTLAAVGSAYEPVDNRAAFDLADRARQLGAVFAHAGETDHGRKAFLTMDLPEARVNVGGKDLVDFGVIFRTSHGSGSITGEVSGMRLVCSNGLVQGIGAGSKWTVRHTRTATDRIALAEDTLRGAARYAKEFAAIGESLISMRYTVDEFVAYIDRLYPRPDEAKKAAVTRWENRRGELLDLFRIAETQEDARGTRWAAYNAVTEWEDWFRPARGGDSGRAARQFATPDAKGVKQAAFDLIAA